MNMINKMKKDKTFRNKILLTVGIIIAFLIGCNIPMPTVKSDALQNWLSMDKVGSMYLFKLMGGTAFSTMSAFALGVSPFITASIILQLVQVIYTPLHEMAKDGKTGKEKYEKIQYILGLVLAAVEAIGMAAYSSKSFLKAGTSNIVITAILMFAGCVVISLMSKAIDKKGIGNGMSLILMFNIISSMPSDFLMIYERYMHEKEIWKAGLAAVVVVLVLAGIFTAIIYLQDTEKRIPVTYSSKVNGRKMVGGRASSIPLKLNMAGVIPVIFSASVFQFISLVLGLAFPENKVCEEIVKYLSMGYWFNKSEPVYTLGVAIYVFFIIMFAYFYNDIQFNVKEVAHNLKESGGMIPGIRSGKPTEEYLTKKTKYLTLLGAICLSIVVLIPMIITGIAGLNGLSFGSTSIIIVVGVIIETKKKLDTELMETHVSAAGLFKKRGGRKNA